MKPTKLVWTAKFQEKYRRKSAQHKESINRALRMMAQNVYHPSLKTHKMRGVGDIRASHATDNQVMTLTLDGSKVNLRNCCNHDDVYKRP